MQTSNNNLSGRAEQLVAARRKAILFAAQQVFERDGLENTTVRAIAKEAGCTTGAIYPWFASKEAIYAELLEVSLDALHQEMQKAFTETPAERSTRAVIYAFFHYYASRPEEFSLGLYLFQGIGQRGLGPAIDQRLNMRLQACIDLFGLSIKRSKGLSAELSAIKQMHIFTYLMGLLLLLHTKRLKSLAQQADELLALFCNDWERN